MLFNKITLIFVDMNKEEALDILQTNQAILSYYIRTGKLRCTKTGSRISDYNDGDIYRLAMKRKNRRDRKDMQSILTPQQIAVALGFGIDGLKSQDRSVSLVDRRRIVASVMKAYGYTQIQTGEFLNRDHSTVAILLKSSYLVEREIKEALQYLKGLGYGKEKKE